MKAELWRWIVGGLAGLVIMLGAAYATTLESRIEKLESFPERIAALETEIRLLREEIVRFREDLREARK